MYNNREDGLGNACVVVAGVLGITVTLAQMNEVRKDSRRAFEQISVLEKKIDDAHTRYMGRLDELEKKVYLSIQPKVENVQPAKKVKSFEQMNDMWDMYSRINTELEKQKKKLKKEASTCEENTQTEGSWPYRTAKKMYNGMQWYIFGRDMEKEEREQKQMIQTTPMDK